jgi:hypothetical protein
LYLYIDYAPNQHVPGEPGRWVPQKIKMSDLGIFGIVANDCSDASSVRWPKTIQHVKNILTKLLRCKTIQDFVDGFYVGKHNLVLRIPKQDLDWSNSPLLDGCYQLCALHREGPFQIDWIYRINSAALLKYFLERGLQFVDTCWYTILGNGVSQLADFCRSEGFSMPQDVSKLYGNAVASGKMSMVQHVLEQRPLDNADQLPYFQNDLPKRFEKELCMFLFQNQRIKYLTCLPIEYLPEALQALEQDPERMATLVTKSFVYAEFSYKYYGYSIKGDYIRILLPLVDISMLSFELAFLLVESPDQMAIMRMALERGLVPSSAFVEDAISAKAIWWFKILVEFKVPLGEALELAVQHRKPELVRWLISQGADPSVDDFRLYRRLNNKRKQKSMAKLLAPAKRIKTELPGCVSSRKQKSLTQLSAPAKRIKTEMPPPGCVS